MDIASRSVGNPFNCMLALRQPSPDEVGPRFVAKDVFDTAGLVTTYGSRIYEDHVPSSTATAVTRMVEAGYVLIGKANLHEFAWGATSENPHYGPVLNPLDPTRIAGGSSGGSAAAIAAGLCETALGTDTGGSIRIPAACCGVVGFKPTYGLIPTDGVFPLSPSLDHVGPLGATVGACARAFEALNGPPVRDASGAPTLALTRVGVLEPFFEGCAPGVREAATKSLDVFAHHEPVVFPAPTAFDNTPLFFAEAAAVHRATFPAREGDYGSDVATRLRLGNEVLARDYLACRDDLRAYRERCLEVFDDVDVLVAPTVPCVAPPLATPEVDVAGHAWPVGAVLTRNTRPFNNLGWPVVALPCGEAEEQLPASLSLIAPPGHDWRLLRFAEAVEQALRG